MQTALRWSLAGLAVHVALAAVFLWSYGGDPQIFVHFGERSSVLGLARDAFGEDLLVPHSDGQDGQAFWVLAHDPLLLAPDQILVPNIDRPAYRAQRVAYPLLAWPWLVGGEKSLLWGLLLTNLLVVFVGGLVTALLAAELGAPPRASLAFSLSPGVVLTTILDVSDGLALVALLGALLAICRGRGAVAVAAATLAVLTKEASWLGVLGAAALAPSIPAGLRWRLALVPAAGAGAWGLYVRWRLGWPETAVEEFSWPFFGYVDALQRGWLPVGNWTDALVAFALLPMGVVVLYRLWTRPSLPVAAAAPFVLVLPFLSAQVLNLMFNTLRVFAPLITLLCLDLYSPAPGPADRDRR